MRTEEENKTGIEREKTVTERNDKRERKRGRERDRD